MGPRLSNGISPCFFAFSKGVEYDRPSLSPLIFWEIFFLLVSSANHTPGSRLYSDLGRIHLHPPAHTQASFKALGCIYNCRRLTCGLFELTHMSCDDHTLQSIKFKRTMAAKMKTKHCYSTHNVTTRVGFGTAKGSHHSCVVRTFVGTS